MRSSSDKVLAVLGVAALRVTAETMPTSTGSTASKTWPSAPAITAQRVTPGQQHQLRQLNSNDANPGNWCGFSSYYTWSCVNTLQSCTNSLFSNGDAYLYCSTVGAPSQIVITTGYDYARGLQSCVSDALCCPSYAPSVQTMYFTRSGYTVTNIACNNVSTPETLGADINALEPASFSAALASLHRSTTPTIPSTSPTKTASPSAHPKSTGSPGGMPSGEKIGIGVGVGVGILGLVLILAAIFLVRPFFVRQRAKIIPEIEGFCPSIEV